MNRRRFVQTVSGVTVLGVSGCVGSDADEPSEAETDNSDDGSETASPESTPEETTTEITPAPDGESYEFQGNGDGVTDSFTLDEGLVAVDFHNFGDGYVGAKIREVGESTGRTLVSEPTGSFDGTGSRGVDGGEYELVVSGDQWEATVRQPRYSEAEYESVPFETDQFDYDLLGPFEFSRDTEVAIDASGFAVVELLTLQGEEISQVLGGGVGEDSYQDSATVGQSGVGLLRVETTSEWTLSVGSQ